MRTVYLLGVNQTKTRERPIKVAQFGLGPIGRSCVQVAAERLNLEIVGGIDIDPTLAHRPLAEICGLSGVAAGIVYPSFEELWQQVQPDVILHTAGSRAVDAFAQCRPMLEKGLAIVSSCEELLFPKFRAAQQTAEIDALCQHTGGRILGSGVNPGFVLDLLPVCLTGVCRTVTSVYGERVVNASLRRQPLQKKIGSGLAPDEFRRLWNEGKAGHAGFKESLMLIASALDWRMEDVQETLEPILATHDIVTPHFRVPVGMTCGLHQIVKAESAEGHRIHLDLKMYLDAEDPHDLVRLESDPVVSARLEGGVFGDMATVASLINCIPRLLSAPPGVRLMTEIPLTGIPLAPRLDAALA
jgi:4-hydroxy-tetrahydrodipicolinate reductase